MAIRQIEGSQRRYHTVRNRHIILATLIALIWSMVGVAVVGINSDSIWYDEYMSFHFAGWPNAGLDIAQIFDRIHSSSDHEAVTYYLILAIWTNFAGWSVFAARLLSLFFGVVAVVLAYRLGVDLRSQAAGLSAAIVLGGSALFNVYLHETRMYSLWILEVMLLIALYWRILRGGWIWVNATLLLLILIATLFTHPLAIALIGALGLYHLFLARRSRTWTWLLATIVLSILLYAPAAVQSLVMAAEVTASGTRSLVAPSLLHFILELIRGLSNGFGLYMLLPLLSLRRWRHDDGLQMLCCVGAVFLSIIACAYLATGFVKHIRYSLPLLPIFALLGGIGLTSQPVKRIVKVAVLGAWCVSGIYSAPAFRSAFYDAQHHDVFHFSFPFEELVATIRLAGGERDAVVFEFPYHSWAVQGVFDYYMYGSRMRYILADTLRAAGTWESTIASFEGFVAEADRLFFVLDRTIDATDLFPEYERILAARFIHCDRIWERAEATIDMYAQKEALCQPSA